MIGAKKHIRDILFEVREVHSVVQFIYPVPYHLERTVPENQVSDLRVGSMIFPLLDKSHRRRVIDRQGSLWQIIKHPVEERVIEVLLILESDGVAGTA